MCIGSLIHCKGQSRRFRYHLPSSPRSQQPTIHHHRSGYHQNNSTKGKSISGQPTNQTTTNDGCHFLLKKTSLLAHSLNQTKQQPLPLSYPAPSLSILELPLPLTDLQNPKSKNQNLHPLPPLLPFVPNPPPYPLPLLSSAIRKTHVTQAVPGKNCNNNNNSHTMQ